MKIKVKILGNYKLGEKFLPKFETKGAACADIRAVKEVHILPGRTELVPTGLSFEIPTGYEFQIRPRSGLSLKTNLRIANSPGTIDSDYRGEVCILMQNTGEQTEQINEGERVAQIALKEVTQFELEIVSMLSETERGSGGFGSTGKV